MKEKEYKRLLKEYEPKRIIYMYIDGKIDLYAKQLKEVINLKNKEEM